MSRGATASRVALGIVGLVAAAFAYLNAGERVAVHLGFATLYQLPLVGVVLFVFIIGMLTMYGVGLRQDLRIRRTLREFGLEDLMDDRGPTAGGSHVESGAAPAGADPGRAIDRDTDLGRSEIDPVFDRDPGTRRPDSRPGQAIEDQPDGARSDRGSGLTHDPRPPPESSP